MHTIAGEHDTVTIHVRPLPFASDDHLHARRLSGGEKHRLGQVSFLQDLHKVTHARRLREFGLPQHLNVLLAPELDAFLNFGEQAVCHGGIALEEVIVPFVEIKQE